MASDFEVFGLDELIECFEALIDKWEEKKVELLNKIGNILDAEIKPLVPVDTSRLADSFSFYVDVSGSLGSVEYGTKASHKADLERVSSLEAKILKGGSDEERAVKAIAETKEYLEIVAGSRVRDNSKCLVF